MPGNENMWSQDENVGDSCGHSAFIVGGMCLACSESTSFTLDV